MRKANQFQYSVVQYRRDPTEPDETSVVLGFAVEFATTDYWVVALGMRAAFTEDELQHIDPLTRDLLKNASEMLKHEIVSVLGASQKPGDVLRKFAANNPWSIHVSAPKMAKLPRKKTEHSASVQRLSDDFLFHAFAIELRPEVTTKSAPKISETREQRPAHRVQQAPDDAMADLESAMPPMWMVRHQFEVPILH